MEPFQKRQKPKQNEEENKEGSLREMTLISEESMLSVRESDDDIFKFQQELEEEILQEAGRDIPDLEDDEELFDGVMAEVLEKLNLEEIYQESPSPAEKIEELLNEDLENCALLVDMISKCIEKQEKYKQLIEQKRKTLSDIIPSIENLEVDNSEEDISNIYRKVQQKFKFLRNKLSDLIEEWSGDKSSEIMEIFSALSHAHLKDTGSEGSYVEVKNFRRDIVQFLVSNRIAVWDKEQERIKFCI